MISRLHPILRSTLPLLMGFLVALNSSCASDVDVEKLFLQSNSDDYEERVEAREKLQELVEQGRVEPFARGLRSENAETRVQSILHLMNMKNPKANDPLVAELEPARRFNVFYNPIRLVPASTPADSRIMIAHILLIRGGDPRATEVLSKAYGTESSVEAKVGTIYALGALDDPKTIPTLKKGLKDPSLEVVKAALEGLTQLTVPGLADSLLPGLSDPSEAVRINSATVLSGFPGKGVSERLGSALQRDPSSAVRRAALRSLANVSGLGAFEPALSLLRSKISDPETRNQAAIVLQGLTGQDFGQDAVKWENWWKSHRDKLEKP